MQPIDRRGRAVAIISTGIVSAVVGGVLHAVLLAVWALSGHFTWVSRDYVWMSPLAAALVLVPGSVTLAALVALSLWSVFRGTSASYRSGED